MKLRPEEYNSAYPILEVEVYQRGLVMVRKGPKQNKYRSGVRKPIDRLSKRALSNLIFLANNTKAKFQSFVTLTYGLQYPISGRETKSDLNRFLVNFRRVYPGESYIWVMEFQKRGAPHFHIMTTVPLSENPRKHRRAIAEMWVRAVLGKGDREYCDLATLQKVNLRARMMAVHEHESQIKELWSKDGAVWYIAKYATKLHQKEVPEQFRSVGRFWGCDLRISRSIKKLYSIPVASRDQLERILIDFGRDDAIEWDVCPKKLVTASTANLHDS